MKLTYRKVGDYLIPNLIPNEEPKPSYSKWGIIRRNFLKNHHPIRFNMLMIDGELIAHLNEIEEQARELWETIMSQLKHQFPSPPQGTMEWVQHQNQLRSIADEQVLHDIIYN